MIDRAAIAAYLIDAYAPLLADFGLPAADTAGALKAPIDRALLRLGVDHGDLATGRVDNAEGALVLASYYLLQAMQGRTAARNVNISMADPSTSKSNRDRAENLRSAMEAVKADIKDLGFGVSASWASGAIGFDIYEPEVVGWS